MKTHTGYAVKAGARETLCNPADPALVPHLRAGSGPAVARQVAAKGALRLTVGVEKTVLPVPKSAAPLLALVDGRRSLGEIAALAGLDVFGFNAAWGSVHRGLTGQGLLLYSRLLL
jgi:hypothetical protein